MPFLYILAVQSSGSGFFPRGHLSLTRMRSSFFFFFSGSSTNIGPFLSSVFELAPNEMAPRPSSSESSSSSSDGGGFLVKFKSEVCLTCFCELAGAAAEARLPFCLFSFSTIRSKGCASPSLIARAPGWVAG